MSVPYGDNFWSKVLNKPASQSEKQQQPRPPRPQQQQNNNNQKSIQPPKQPEQVAKNKPCKVCGTVGHTAQSCPNFNKVCNNCGAKGHFARNCTLSLFDFPRYNKCSVCFEEGHAARNCPNKSKLQPRPVEESEQPFRPVREKKKKEDTPKAEEPQEHNKDAIKEGQVNGEDKNEQEKQKEEVDVPDVSTKPEQESGATAEKETKPVEETKDEAKEGQPEANKEEPANDPTENGSKSKKKKKKAKKPVAPPKLAWVIEEPELEEAHAPEAFAASETSVQEGEQVEDWKALVEELRAELAATKEREEQLKKQVSELQKKLKEKK